MMKPFLKRITLFSLVLIGCLLVYYFLSEGRPTVPDASHYRNILYTYTFIIMPLIILCDVIYLFSVLTKKPIRMALISLTLGASGPLLLFYSVKASSDPMASMAFIGIAVFYAVTSSLIFMVLTLFEWLIRTTKKRA